MKYTLLASQKEFLEVPHNLSFDVAVYQGGFGSGKTFAGSLLGILLALKYPKIKGLVGAQTFPLVRDTTLVSYFEHLQKLGFKENFDYKYSKSEQKICFKNGSEILFRYFDEPNKLKSLNLGFAEIEEMSDVPQSTFNMLLARLRQTKEKNWKNFKYRLFGHTNPENPKGWIYELFSKSKKPNYRLILAPSTQNIFLPENYIEELKENYSEKYYNINVLGLWDESISLNIVHDFSNENIRKINYNKDLDLHITCDFNVDPMSWVLAHKSENKAYFFDEIILENTTTQKACEFFLQKYPDHKGKIIINGDASGDNRSTQSEFSNYMIIKKCLQEHGYNDFDFKIKNFNPPIKNRIISFNAKIRNSKGEIGIFIDPKCEKLIYNMKELKYKEGTSQIDLPSFHQIKSNRELKFLSHPFDAASYLIEYYWPLG